MLSSRQGTPRSRRLALWAGLAIMGALPSVGCQVEYAGMTLPSGKYMHDDVHYFEPGPHFRLANTQAATQRARMRSMGLDVPSAEPVGPIGGAPRAAGAIDPTQNMRGGPSNINTQRMPGTATPPPPPPGLNDDPGAVPPPGGARPGDAPIMPGEGAAGVGAIPG